MSKPVEYLCQIDSEEVPPAGLTTAVLAPNGIYWNVSVSTAGVLTVVDTNYGGNTFYIMGMNGTAWELTISNAGVLSFNSTATYLTSASSDTVASLIDSNSVVWYLMVNLEDQLIISTETPLDNKYYYPAITIVYTASASTDTFELYAVKANTSMHRR